MSSTRFAALYAACLTPLCAIVFASDAIAHSYQVSGLAIGHPWSRETAPGQSVGGGFLTVTNRGKTDDRLIAVTSPVAAQVQLHTMTMDGGVMRMREVTGGLAVPAGGTLELKPGGYHIMFIGLKKSLKAGERVPATLTFQRAGTVQVAFAVQPATSTGPMEMPHAGH
ncbi:copper chaperone PCu(A)C [Novosphingobium pokkalii]|uniref:Copper chaperone PCu(A)C n=1 Tax=Novosphingobium pokkalii TaxID=1770194 RepID=A0ABV7V566_9SPHN|nr:copper chaperone PCu(A)C [Novosphingobium pokkalii]GHD04009.1 hypothetical protein GCM10019060_40540 [Novosphingobium pokkalii]